MGRTVSVLESIFQIWKVFFSYTEVLFSYVKVFKFLLYQRYFIPLK